MYLLNLWTCSSEWFSLVKRFVVDFVEVLQNGKRADFTDDSGEQSVNVFGVVSDEEELVAKQGEVGLDVLAYLFAQARRQFAAVVVLPSGDKVRHLALEYGKLVEQVVLAVDPQGLRSQAQRDDFKV